ncbi:MAG: hypothetical protein EOP81_13995 [Variovorax sp.]|nr:MAG: hypothetical protein EOP81_13995 [Variovorax sp.]
MDPLTNLAFLREHGKRLQGVTLALQYSMLRRDAASPQDAEHERKVLDELHQLVRATTHAYLEEAARLNQRTWHSRSASDCNKCSNICRTPRMDERAGNAGDMHGTPAMRG